MSILKRLSATISAQVDHMVSQIENHDAVIEAAIRDARQAAARAKVRLARVKRDGAGLKHKIASLQQAEKQWTDRARSCAATDEDKALACMQRRRECQRQMTVLQQALREHASLEERLDRDIRTAESRLSEMAQQRNLMRTRQSAAEALRSISSLDEDVAIDVNEAFERWEINVTEAELAAGSTELTDGIEREFLDVEDKATLRAELDALLNDKEHDNG
ncbi:MAG: hypothetical protein AMJ69_01010 [Gammaproteobacteria bacterium SG8_47]|nr:MAG: hypothetical protein AMJ69_01010 [Gammaproteobacteria bacterium SG8_47]